MKIFLDTAEIEEIRIAARWGVLDGVTTNPSLFAKVATNDPVGRAAHLAPLPPAVLGAVEREAAIASDDAFDAVVSALAMWERRSELRALEPATDPTARLEGEIWL